MNRLTIAAIMLIGSDVGKRLGSRVVLRRVHFQIPSGQIAAVLGANGSGKSTLLRLAAALMPLDAGEITWREEDAAASTCDVREGQIWRAECGLCAPDAPLYRELTCGENLQFWAQMKRGAPPKTDKELRAALGHWQLGARWNDVAGSLSSGLRARLAMCVATLHAPRLWLLDEPSANLDEAGRELLHAALQEQRARGVAIVATNDDREAAWCDLKIEL